MDCCSSNVSRYQKNEYIKKYYVNVWSSGKIIKLDRHTKCQLWQSHLTVNREYAQISLQKQEHRNSGFQYWGSITLLEVSFSWQDVQLKITLSPRRSQGTISKNGSGCSLCPDQYLAFAEKQMIWPLPLLFVGVSSEQLGISNGYFAFSLLQVSPREERQLICYLQFYWYLRIPIKSHSFHRNTLIQNCFRCLEAENWTYLLPGLTETWQVPSWLKLLHKIRFLLKWILNWS